MPLFIQFEHCEPSQAYQALKTKRHEQYEKGNQTLHSSPQAFFNSNQTPQPLTRLITLHALEIDPDNQMRDSCNTIVSIFSQTILASDKSKQEKDHLKVALREACIDIKQLSPNALISTLFINLIRVEKNLERELSTHPREMAEEPLLSSSSSL